MSTFCQAPRARHVGRGSNLQHCALFSLGRRDEERGVCSVCVKRAESQTRQRYGRRGQTEGGEEEKGERNERRGRVCKEKTKTLSKSWSCFQRRLVVVVVGWARGAGGQRRLPQRRSGWAGGLLSGGDCGRRGRWRRAGGRRGVVREPGR